MGAPEHYVEGYLQRRCKSLGMLCFKFTSPSMSGVPDRIVIHNGHVAFVETKRPGDKPRKLQVKRIEQMRSHGADVTVCDTREKVDELLERLSKEGGAPDAE